MWHAVLVYLDIAVHREAWRADVNELFCGSKIASMFNEEEKLLNAVFVSRNA